MRAFRRIYVYVYAALSAFGSGDAAYRASSFVVAVAIVTHAFAILVLANGFAGRDLIQSFGKTGVVIFALVAMIGSTYFLDGTGRARRIVNAAGDALRLTRTKWIGLAIIVWTLAVPFLSLTLRVFLHSRGIM